MRRGPEAVKGRAGEPSTEAEESGGGTDPKGDEPRPKETAGNEPQERTERGREAGSRKGRPEETKAGRVGRAEEADRKESGERTGRVEATVRRKLEAGKGRSRDQVAES